MKTVAFLISSNMVEGREDAREDVYEFHLEFDQLSPPCRGMGITLDPVVWDELDSVDHYDAIVIGPAWDYVEKHAGFVETIKRFEAYCQVHNSSRVIEWNASKTYLKDLESAGLATIPTLWVDRVDEDSVQRGYEHFHTDRLIAKPVIGASAWRQAVLNRGDEWPAAETLPPSAAMLQPFLPSVKEDGEISLLFFGGEFSHAARKIPSKSDYRVQSIFGGREVDHDPSDEAIELGRAALAEAASRCGESDLLYGRVDLVGGLDGDLNLIELELIEPYLYPEQGPDMGEAFARALARKLSISV